MASRSLPHDSSVPPQAPLRRDDRPLRQAQDRPFFYGGQAVIEGVMVRGRRHVAVAVRSPDGQIIVRTDPLSGLYVGPLRRLPVVRGVLALAELLQLGVKSLLYSVNVAMGKGGEQVSTGMVWGMVVPALAFGVALFFLLPVLVVRLFDEALGSSIASNVVEGVLRLGLFLGYLWFISQLKDIRRVLAYHGAEHKTIHAHEAGLPLEVPTVQRFRTAHPRCGTSFLLVVMVVSILVFALLGTPPLWAHLLSRVALIPVIAGASYELLRLAASPRYGRLLEWLRWPGVALQALTTKQPDDAQVEVAIRAFAAAAEADSMATAPPSAEPLQT